MELPSHQLRPLSCGESLRLHYMKAILPTHRGEVIDVTRPEGRYQHSQQGVVVSPRDAYLSELRRIVSSVYHLLELCVRPSVQARCRQQTELGCRQESPSPWLRSPHFRYQPNREEGSKRRRASISSSFSVNPRLSLRDLRVC